MRKKRKQPTTQTLSDDEVYMQWRAFHTLRGEWGKQLANQIAIERDIKLFGFVRDKTKQTLYPIY